MASVSSKAALLLAVVGLAACASAEPPSGPVPETLESGAVAPDLYGLNEDNPICVAGLGGRYKPDNEDIFLQRLRCPSGEKPTYKRQGGCCLFDTPNVPPGFQGLLDVYLVQCPGQEPVEVYLNMYDPGDVRAPAGFTLEER